MTLSTLVKGIIQTENYYPTRNSEIKWIINHTAQCPTQVGRGKFIMEFLKPASRRASAHIGLDQEEIWAGAQEEHTCFAAPSANAAGLHIEHAAYAEYGSSTSWPSWTDPAIHQMIFQKAVPLMVDWCRRYGIPPVVLEPADLLAGKKGISDHIRCTRAFGGSHWDCGPQYPLYEVVEEVKFRLNGGSSPTPIKDEDDMKLYVTDNGSLWFVGGSTCSQFVPSGNGWEADKWAIDHLLRTGAISEYNDPADKSKRLPLGALLRVPVAK